MWDVDNLFSLAPSLNQLSSIIGSVAAPAFLLGAVAAFISVLMSRMNRVIDRSQYLHKLSDSDETSYLKADIPRLKRRAKLLNRSVLYATISAIVTASWSLWLLLARCCTLPMSTALRFCLSSLSHSSCYLWSISPARRALVFMTWITMRSGGEAVFT